eukprot:7167586-Alexandrium_andersonii.AAC.1
MSASLVGSEMCIRDRLSGHGLSEQGLALLAQAPVVHLLCTAVLTLLDVCLLYTSDAADDM